MKILILMLLFTSSVFSINIKLLDKSIGNGKTTLLEIEKENSTLVSKIVSEKHEYKLQQNRLDKNKLYALIPISYYEKPHKKKITIFYEEEGIQKSTTVFLTIKDAKYKKESIRVGNSRVNLSKKDKKRAAKEYAEAMKIYNSSSDKNYITSKFIQPIKSKMTSSFGKERVYNGTHKGYHSGTDFRAKIGTKIIACNDGKVVLAKDRFYSGGSVIIDHGNGIYSCYYHMSKFNVKSGDIVKKEQVIGLSGSSGRVTGPHLHFSVRVQGLQVDPLQFIELINMKYN